MSKLGKSRRREITGIPSPATGEGRGRTHRPPPTTAIGILKCVGARLSSLPFIKPQATREKRMTKFPILASFVAQELLLIEAETENQALYAAARRYLSFCENPDDLRISTTGVQNQNGHNPTLELEEIRGKRTWIKHGIFTVLLFNNQQSMSNYLATAINPKNGEPETVWMLDDHFGRHNYGVQFPNGEIYPDTEVKILSPKECETKAEDCEKGDD